MTLTRSATAYLVAAAVATVLVGCGADPRAEGRSESTSAPPSDPPPATSSARASEPQGDAGAEPVCEGVTLEEGVAVTGTALSECVADVMRAAGSGRMAVSSTPPAGFQGDVSFTFDPRFRAHAVSAVGASEFVVVDGGGWISDGARWIEADPDSSDPMTAAAGQVFVAIQKLADPRVATALALADGEWVVRGEEDVDRPDDRSAVAWRIDLAQPFTTAGVTVKRMSLWMDADREVLRHEGTTSALGQTVTTVNDYSDWGDPVDIEVPAG